jgi:hypothetical protein
MATLQETLRHFHRSATLYQKYHQAHSELVALVEAISNVHSRLPSLQTPGPCLQAHSQDAQSVSKRVYVRQLHELERLHQSLNSQMCEPPALVLRHTCESHEIMRMRGLYGSIVCWLPRFCWLCRHEVHVLVRQLAQRHADAAGALKRANLSRHARSHKLGADPSISELLAAMGSMHSMTAQQSAVEAHVLDAITYETGSSELDEIVQYFRGEFS